MARYLHAPEFAVPRPAHTLTDGALAAVATMRRLGDERRVERLISGWEDGRGIHRGGLVTKHGNPRARTPWEGEVETSGARSLLALAIARGFTAQMLIAGDVCAVEGHHPSRVGFRARWLRGAAHGGSWHAPRRYELIEDHRPIGIDLKAKTGKVGYRSAGVGTTRLSMVASPSGLPINVTEVRRRVDLVGS